MADFETLDQESEFIIRAAEIAVKEKLILESAVRELVTSGSSSFENGSKRYLLSKSGESHNPGYQIETENLDGSGRFRNSWIAAKGDEDWQISCIINQVTRLIATVESD
jgi:hypothetical protein